MDMEMITDLMEAVMILCFGLSWPISIRKSWVSRTAKGKSLFFECFIWIGYVFGIARKFMQHMECCRNTRKSVPTAVFSCIE